MEAVPVEDAFITGDGDQQTRALVNDGSSFDNLDKSDHYYRFLFHGNPFPGWIYDLETLQFVDVNDAAVEFYGYSKQEFLSMKLTDIRPGGKLIAKSSQNLINVITEIRNLSRSLMNPSLGDLGLTDSIQDLVENMNATKKAHVCFQYNDINEKRLSENQKLTLFRIAQEALNNVMKHAEARQIMIKLSDQKIQYNY